VHYNALYLGAAVKIKESVLFKKFAGKHFGPKEEILYRLQIREIIGEKQFGKVEKSLKTQDGEACITYFYYEKETGIVYALSGHLVRSGEPRKSELEAVVRFLKEIEGNKP
jgi:hypothetical protein